MLSKSLQQIPHCVHEVQLMHPVDAEGLLEFSPDSICVACFPYAVLGIAGSCDNFFCHPPSVRIQKSPIENGEHGEASPGLLLCLFSVCTSDCCHLALVLRVSEAEQCVWEKDLLLINPQILL